MKNITRRCSRKQKYASMLTMTRTGTSCQTLPSKELRNFHQLPKCYKHINDHGYVKSGTGNLYSDSIKLLFQVGQH